VKVDVITTSASKEGFDGVFYPAKQPENAIIFVSGSEGGLGTGKKIAAYYQSFGYSALALGMFHTKGTNKTLSEVPLEYMEKAIVWLKERGYNRIVADGISRGSEYVLYSATVMPEIRGVIARVPSYFIGEGLTDRTPSGSSAWSYRGNPLPYTPYKTRKINRLKNWMKEQQFSLMSMNENKEVAPDSVIPVEKIHGPVLLMATQADTVWPSADYTKQLTSRFAETRFPYAVRAMTFQYVSHMLVPILHYRSLKLIRVLFRSERLHPGECVKERDEMEKATLTFLRKAFAFDGEQD
jgi:dienelactone hydrolase